jgi:hypothetical protein
VRALLTQALFDEWKAERGRRYLSTPCPCCNQVVERTIIAFPFESGPDENVENGDTDTDTGPPKPRKWWRQIIAGIFCFLLGGDIFDRVVLRICLVGGIGQETNPHMCMDVKSSHTALCSALCPTAAFREERMVKYRKVVVTQFEHECRLVVKYWKDVVNERELERRHKALKRKRRAEMDILREARFNKIIDEHGLGSLNLFFAAALACLFCVGDYDRYY